MTDSPSRPNRNGQLELWKIFSRNQDGPKLELELMLPSTLIPITSTPADDIRNARAFVVERLAPQLVGNRTLDDIEIAVAADLILIFAYNIASAAIVRCKEQNDHL